jgi:hypothetical protein
LNGYRYIILIENDICVKVERARPPDTKDLEIWRQGPYVWTTG